MEKSCNSRILARLFDKNTDYQMISKWWELHGSFVPHEEHLPNTGFVIEFNKLPVCAGFLYRTDSKICVFEFVVSDPEATKEVKNVCLNELITQVTAWSKENKFSLIYTSIAIPRYISRLIEQGFIKADTGQTHMFKVMENV